MKADRAIGTVLLLFAVAVTWAASRPEILPGTHGLITPRTLPYTLGVVIGICALVLMARPSPRPLRDALVRMLHARTLVFIALLAVYGICFRYVDFRLGTWTFMLCSMLVLGERRPLMLILVPIAATLTVFFIFRFGFTVLVPTWI